MPFPMHLRSLSGSRAIAGFALSVGLVLLCPSVSGAKAVRPARMVELADMVDNPNTAAGAIPQIRQVLADSLDEIYVPMVRGLILSALMRIDAPIPEIVDQADSLDRAMTPTDPRRLDFLSMAAEELLGRGKEPGPALRFAEMAIGLCPGDPKYAGICSKYQTLLGRAQFANGQTEAAIASLLKATAVAPDSQIALYHLGRAQEKAGRVDEAISCYVRSLGVFASRDSLAGPPLRALYQKRHGSLSGLERKVSEARSSSTRILALDAYRHEKPAPDWTLPDLEGNAVRSADFQGKLLIVLFWSTTGENCGEALYAIQNLYRDYKDRGLAAEAINWEQGLSADLRLEIAKRAVKRVGVWVPVLVDDPHAVFDAFEVQEVPQFFLIDREGLIRFRIPGLPGNLDAVLTAQIESLLQHTK